MIVLLDTSHDLSVCAKELGCEVGQLITPLNGLRLRDGARFAVDNGAFSGFRPEAFLRRLDRAQSERERCIFVAVPDVVGSARRTLEVFERWVPRLDGWPLALVAQDGQENLPIPWDEIEAIFIGGSTEWKLSPYAAQIIKAAKALGKWAHVGRVNTPARFKWAEDAGADSIDGTGLSRYTWMREEIFQRETHSAGSCTCDLLHTASGCPTHT